MGWTRTRVRLRRCKVAGPRVRYRVRLRLRASYGATRAATPVHDVATRIDRTQGASGRPGPYKRLASFVLATITVVALKPSRDPSVPHPGRVFYRGQWRTPEQAARNRERDRQWKRKRFETDANYRTKERRDTLERTLKRQRAFTAWLAGIKGTTCSECGGEFEPAELHFHHVDPATKLFVVSAAANRSREKVLAEIEKCVVVCGSCHNRIEPRSSLSI